MSAQPLKENKKTVSHSFFKQGWELNYKILPCDVQNSLSQVSKVSSKCMYGIFLNLQRGFLQSSKLIYINQMGVTFK